MKIEYTPYGAAKTLFQSRAREIVLSGAAGTGKSLACLMKVFVCCMKYPKTRALIVRKSRESLTSTGMVTWEQHVIPNAMKIGAVSFYGGSKREAAQYRFSNGSAVMIGGMDNATKVMSSEYDLIFVQEAIELKPDHWEKLTTRLRNGKMPYQQLMADTNPDASTHWLHQRSLDGKTVMVQSVHEDNPTLWDREKLEWTPKGAEYLKLLDQLSGVNYERLRNGIWAAAEGVIYEDFSQRTHVVDPFPIPHSWPRYWSIDFGFTNPFVCQMWAEDPDGRLYMYQEVYMSQRIVEEQAKHILGLVSRDGVWTEPKPQAVITDHDAEDRETFTKHTGLSTTAARKTVSRGIEAVKQRLKVQEDGKPRVMFFKNALVERDRHMVLKNKPCSTVEEMPAYIWSEQKTDKGDDMPVKVDDHGVDCLRYMIAHKELRRQPKVAVVRR